MKKNKHNDRDLYASVYMLQVTSYNDRGHTTIYTRYMHVPKDQLVADSTQFKLDLKSSEKTQVTLNDVGIYTKNKRS